MCLLIKNTRKHVILTVYTFLAMVQSCCSDMVGCYHCKVTSGCSLQDEGIVDHQEHCSDHCTQVDTCYGVQFDFLAKQCYSFQSASTCTGLEYTADDVFVYRKSDRSGCLLFTLVFSSGWRFSDSYKIREIDTSTRPRCLHEGLEMDTCFHVVYKAGWTDCYMFDECNICTPFTASGYDKYDFDCTADCGQLTNPAHGTVNTDSGTIQEKTARYSCDAGFQLIGAEVRTCDATGTWTDSAPTCEAIDCGDPPTISHGDVHFIFTTEGSVATYSCHDGYNISVGFSFLWCLSNSQWSGAPPSCQAMDCGPLDTPAWGSVVYNTTTYPSVAVYFCDPGYNITGVTTRSCTSNGSWEGDVPTCNATECAPLTVPENGGIFYGSGSNRSYYGDEVTYSCNPGYVLNGNLKRQCNAAGIWTGTMPTCEAEVGTSIPITPAPTTPTTTTPAPPVILPSVPATTSQVITTTTLSPTTNTPLQATYTTAATATKPKPIYLWPCLCSNKSFTGLTQTEIIEQLVNDVRIDEDKTKLALSKKACMNDTRTSARSVGILGIALLVAFGGLILLSDLFGLMSCRDCGKQISSHQS